MSWKVVKSIPKSAREVKLPTDYYELAAWLDEHGLFCSCLIHEVWETKANYYVVATPKGSTSAFIYRVKKVKVDD